MARYIDADKMREEWLENGENEYVYDTNSVLDSIDEQPTADVVEVVKCEDCKYLMKEVVVAPTPYGFENEKIEFGC